MIVNYKGVPDAIRNVARHLQKAISDQELDTTARIYHQQNGEGWENAMLKDLKMRVIEQRGPSVEGYLGTTDGRNN